MRLREQHGVRWAHGPHPSGALAYKAHYEKNLTARHDDFRPHIETTKGVVARVRETDDGDTW